MANIKEDLLNEFRTKKYFAEMELVRLAQEPNMAYKHKIDMIGELLSEIGNINQKIGLTDGYFTIPEPVQQEPVANEPVQQEPVANEPAATPLVHQGQSHGE